MPRGAMLGTGESATNWVVLAEVRRPWGRHGDLLLGLHTDWPAARFSAGTELIFAWPDGRRRTAIVDLFAEVSGDFHLRLQGVTSINEARQFARAAIIAARETLTRPDAAELLHADLVGCSVIDRAGAELGIVGGIEETAGSDLLAVELRRGGQVLIPYVPAICIGFDREARRLVVDPPVGLLDPSLAVEVEAGNRAER